MYKLYQEGFSLTEVGEAFGKARQTVFKAFDSRGWPRRKRPRPLPFLTFRGHRYTLRNTGYYGRTNGLRSLMHRDVWEHHNGTIPAGHDVHHKNSRLDNRIENLELIEKAEHTRLHWRLKRAANG